MRQLLCSALFCSVLGIFNKITRQLHHVNAIDFSGALFWFGIIDLECICVVDGGSVINGAYPV